MKTIIGLYDDHHTAQKVERTLEKEDFDRDSIRSYHHHAAGTDTGLFSGDRRETLTRHGVPQDEAEFFIEGVRRGGSLVMVRAEDDRAMRAAEIMNQHDPVRREERMKSWREQGYTGYKSGAPLFTEDEAKRERARYTDVTDRERTTKQPATGKTKTGATAKTEERVPIVEEDVHVGKREVARGKVSVHTWVEEKPVEERVNLHEEHVDVERRKVDRPVSDKDDAFRERTIEMEETAEEVVAEKEARVVEEVIVSKKGEDRTETVRDTVRRTRVDVDEETAHARTGYADYADTFRTHYRSNYAGDGKRSYEDYEPAYRHGYTYATNDQHMSRDYGALEPDMQRSYEERHGKGTWSRVKDAARHAFRTGRDSTTSETTTPTRTMHDRSR